MSGLKNKEDKTFLSLKRASLTLMSGAILLSASQVSQGVGLDTIISALKGFTGLSADSISERILIGSSQTSVVPQQVGTSMQESAKASAAISMAENRAHRIREIYEGMTPNVGLPDSMQCVATAERTQSQAILGMSKDNTAKDSLFVAADYSNSRADKQSDRVFVHLTRFCDVSEGAAGVCVPPATGMSGQDTNYSVIGGNDLMNAYQKEAAYAFMRNVIDPSEIDIEGCKSAACASITTSSRAYKGLASMVHGAYLSQINDSLKQDYGEVGKSTNIKVDADGNPPVMTNPPATDDTKPPVADDTKPPVTGADSAPPVDTAQNKK